VKKQWMNFRDVSTFSSYAPNNTATSAASKSCNSRTAAVMTNVAHDCLAGLT